MWRRCLPLLSLAALTRYAPAPPAWAALLRLTSGGLPAPAAQPPALGPVLAADAVTGLVTLACWALSLWLTLAVLADAAARLPGAGGRFGRTVLAALAVLTPSLVRRLLGVGMGATLLAGPALATSSAAATATGCPPSTVNGQLAPGRLPSLDRPVPTCPAVASPSATPKPAPVTPVHAPSNVPRSPTSVRVQPGDNLWSLAARDLQAASGHAPSAAAIAASWPKWWRANRAVVGADPNLVFPGEILHDPS